MSSHIYIRKTLRYREMWERSQKDSLFIREEIQVVNQIIKKRTLLGTIIAIN